MARGEHHRIHAQDRVQRNRLRIAQEAARLMSEHGIRDFHHAKLKAAERLGIFDTQALPRNNEIEEALREHQRLFRAEEQTQALRTRREAARGVMRFLEIFEPRLVGPVLSGTADTHSPVNLHVFDDSPERVATYLLDHGVAFETRAHTFRLDRQRNAEFPVFLFDAEGVAVDVTVFPRDALRQAPLDRTDERPQQRASLAALEMMLADNQRLSSDT